MKIESFDCQIKDKSRDFFGSGKIRKDIKLYLFNDMLLWTNEENKFKDQMFYLKNNNNNNNNNNNSNKNNKNFVKNWTKYNVSRLSIRIKDSHREECYMRQEKKEFEFVFKNQGMFVCLFVCCVLQKIKMETKKKYLSVLCSRRAFFLSCFIMVYHLSTQNCLKLD